MKRLIFIRHGKSSWKHEVEDAQRPLKKRAYKDAEKVLKKLKPLFEGPAVLWSSFATRALDSARIFKEGLRVKDENFFVKKELYTFDDRQLLKTIATCDDSIDQLIVFGHNPAITEAVNFLGNQIFDNVPTTGLVAIDFDSASWSGLKNGETTFFLFPKDL